MTYNMRSNVDFRMWVCMCACALVQALAVVTPLRSKWVTGNVGGALLGITLLGMLLALSGMQNIQQSAVQHPLRRPPSPHPQRRIVLPQMPVALPLKNTAFTVWKNPQQLCELETVYNSFVN